MKNKRDDLVNKLIINFLIEIGIWTLFIPALELVLVLITNVFDFQFVYDVSPNIYNYMKALITSIFDGDYLILMFIIWIIGILVIVYKLVKKVFSYINEITDASENLLNMEVEYIELPRELEDLQIKMNHLKRESEKNERLARESEQKKNDLIVYLAHDLKTPLTSMIGYLSLLDEIKDMPKKQREKYISVALEKSYRLEDLINELFDIARFNSETIVLEKEEVNLILMLEQIIDDFYPVLQENDKEIKFDCKSKIIIDGDPDKLARVFGNLIKNAINYSTDRIININIKEINDSVIIIMSNKGKKIPKEKLNKIFEKFYRADQSRTSKTGGTGLGLAIAKEIVELHGGEIKATSDDEYTRFSVKLPFKIIK